MSKFLQTTNRTISWFKRTNDNNDLQMKPPFQRNPVWTTPQKRYLIDSILNGFPVPELYMQEFIDDQGNERHVIVDGQQRIRACLEFIEGRFALDEESPTWANMRFEDLSANDKKTIFSYTFIVRVLPDIPDEEIRGIFQRINKNVVALNAQELRQATYWGPFIKTMQEIANYAYWSSSGIFTPVNIRRMMDVEFISELAIAILHGHQNKKETIDRYYLEYEEEFDSKEELITIFQKTLLEIEQIYPDIKNTRWKKKTDFYSLFTYFATQITYFPLSLGVRQQVRDALDPFAKQVTLFLSTDSELPRADFSSEIVDYGISVRASSDIGNRKRRHEALERELGKFFSENSKGSLNFPIKPIQEGLLIRQIRVS
ncbi:DUF262 domain-containing protein [Candidatus Gracilibacteria bacterium]|nr:DUF262 domain-containing protein [Candidatus Gracilibacteria bacterium]